MKHFLLPSRKNIFVINCLKVLQTLIDYNFTFAGVQQGSGETFVEEGSHPGHTGRNQLF